VIHKFTKQIITQKKDIKVVKTDPINNVTGSSVSQATQPVKTVIPSKQITKKQRVLSKKSGLDFYEECDVRGNPYSVDDITESKEVVGICQSKSKIRACTVRRTRQETIGSIYNKNKLQIFKSRSGINKYIQGIVACKNKPRILNGIFGQSLERIIKGALKVYTFRDVYTGRRILMKNLGIDVGTKTIVVAFRNGEQTEYISEINGYYPFERCTPFIKNMLNDPNKVRSDGTSRPARWFELDGKAIVLGRDAEEFAYSKNDTLLRPMAEGGIAADEEAMTVLASIVQGLISMAEKEIGKFEDKVKLCYCTTAPAINKESNIDYHKRVVNLVIEGYESEADISHENIKESHAIVIDMSQDGTGIGISWGAGTVTVSYVKYGLEVYSFCWVGAGDWIDTQVAMRHGYDPQALNTMKKKYKETPTTVAKKKCDVDLTPGVDYSGDRLAMDIVLHYDVLINQVIEGIVAGFEQNESEARIEDAIPIFMAGGTSSPSGFVERCKLKFEETEPPFKVGDISRAADPLYSVATGCLKAAEMF